VTIIDDEKVEELEFFEVAFNHQIKDMRDVPCRIRTRVVIFDDDGESSG
jgi:hypothetical protein